MAVIKKLVELDYPNQLVTQPILSRLVKKYGL